MFHVPLLVNIKWQIKKPRKIQKYIPLYKIHWGQNSVKQSVGEVYVCHVPLRRLNPPQQQCWKGCTYSNATKPDASTTVNPPIMLFLKHFLLVRPLHKAEKSKVHKYFGFLSKIRLRTQKSITQWTIQHAHTEFSQIVLIVLTDQTRKIDSDILNAPMQQHNATIFIYQSTPKSPRQADQIFTFAF